MQHPYSLAKRGMRREQSDSTVQMNMRSCLPDQISFIRLRQITKISVWSLFWANSRPGENNEFGERSTLQCQHSSLPATQTGITFWPHSAKLSSPMIRRWNQSHSALRVENSSNQRRDCEDSSSCTVESQAKQDNKRYSSLQVFPDNREVYSTVTCSYKLPSLPKRETTLCDSDSETGTVRGTRMTMKMS